MQQRRKKEQWPTKASWDDGNSLKERKRLPLSEPNPETPGGGGVGGGMDLPQGFAEETSSLSKSRRRRQDNGGDGWIYGFVFLLVIVLVAGYYLVAHHEKQQLDHLRKKIVHDQVEPLSIKLEEKYAELLEKNKKLVTEAEQYSTLKEDNERINEQQHQANTLRTNLDKRIEYLAKYKKTIQGSIQDMHKAVLLEK
jgi:hypothetical protein